MAAKITRRRFIKYSILAGSALGVGLGGRLLLSESSLGSRGVRFPHG